MKTFTIKTAWNQYGQLIGDVLGHDRESLEQDFAKYQIVQPAASVKDYMWGLFNRMLMESPGDLHTQSMLYHSMAVFMSIYEGKNCNQYARQAIAQEVKKAQVESKENENCIWELKIVADPDCDHTQSLDGIGFPITDDLVLPLADENCTREFCRCSVTRRAKRDENGRIIFINRRQQKPKAKNWWEFWK